MAKKPQLKFSRSEALESALAQRVRDKCLVQIVWGPDASAPGGIKSVEKPAKISMPIDQVRDRVKCYQHCHYVGYGKEDSPDNWEGPVPKNLVAKCRKVFEGETELTYVQVGRLFYVMSGAEADILSAFAQAWLEQDVEEKLEPLFRAELKSKVHKFLAERAIYSRRGGKYRARDDVRGFAKGYLAAWEKFDQGRTHPRPYVLAPCYGKGVSAVAYLLSDPPEKILEDAENEFAVHIVMGS